MTASFQRPGPRPWAQLECVGGGGCCFLSPSLSLSLSLSAFVYPSYILTYSQCFLAFPYPPSLRLIRG